MAAQSNQIDIMRRLHVDLSIQNRYLLIEVEVRLQLIWPKNNFYLHGHAAEFKVSLKKVVLFVHKVKPNSSTQLAHTKALQPATTKYPLRRVRIKSFIVPMENQSITKKSLFLGQLPTRIVIAVVKNDAYNGAIHKSPFNFKHNNINFITIYRGSV